MIGYSRGGRSAPVGLEADGKVVAVALERGELTDPIDCARGHGSPSWLLGIGNFPDVFTVAMTNTIFRQELIAFRVWSLAARCGIAGIPIDHEGCRLHASKSLCRFSRGRRVAGEFVF